ncbi:MAG: tetratricopeptide repeat protein, partial [Deltaproteobacteria bacterium]|nr:tetratricopeptide repeat protein [Deltaproteobacteria bacterium]
MSTSHLDRKALKRPDAFLERINNLFTYINENSGSFLAILGVLFAIGLGVTFYISHSDKAAHEADSALYDARQVLDKGVAKVKDKPAEWMTAAQPGLDAVEKVAKNFAGSRASFEAFLLIGDAYFQHGNAAKAVDYYKLASDNAKPRAARPMAQYSLAYAYENMKNHDGAVDSLRHVISSGDKTLKADSMMALARNY